MFDSLPASLASLRNMPGLESPLLRWGLVAIGVILLWAMLCAPYLAWRGSEIEMIHAQAAKLDRLQALTKVSRRWQSADIALKQRVAGLNKFFFQGSSYATVQTDMLQAVRSKMRKFHVVVESQRLLDAEAVAGIGEKVSIHLRVHGSLADMLALVDALSRSQRLFIADALYIASLRQGEALMQLELSSYRLLVQEPVS